ncbi:pyridoxal-phosphate dependent enzyme [Pseudomonas cremoricolorata]|uniref:L-serine ammonia-lyase n=1 Tax=Pseudomonas cremoricolorata TaxID=157783 RepID=A0A089YGT1_9PSED|nr:pyridoxal-phosphate dependent enzyme [Pseudomonas cremoricolorata]AIR90923.1 serine dehydratase [Pseudomonas cremoricolorata]
MTLHINTPLLESRPLSQATGRRIWLKLDALQPSGSFKLRGVGHACESHFARGARRFVSSSGGNAGLAVAYAGRQLGLPVTVVVPETTSAHAKTLLALEDAEVIVHGSSWHEANALALTLVGEDAAFIHPFDDPLLWTGHASLVDEVAKAGVVPDAVVLAVGGGGLLSGVVEGLQRNGWEHVPVLAVETEGAASFNASLQIDTLVELKQIESIATSLGAKRVAEQALVCARQHPVSSHLVTDLQAVRACERFLHDHRVLVEPACGAALALAYDGQRLGEAQNVLVVVCGGATATSEQIVAWREALTPA